MLLGCFVIDDEFFAHRLPVSIDAIIPSPGFKHSLYFV